MKYIYILYCFIACINTISAQVVINQSKCFGGSGLDYAEHYCLTSSGGYLVCGCTTSMDGDVSASISGGVDIWILKLNSALNIQSSYLYGGSVEDCALGIIEFSPNIFIVAGITNSPDWPANGSSGYGDDDLFVMAIDSVGNELWSRRLGGSNYDRYPEMIKTRDGKILISGMTNSANNEAASSHGRQDGLLVKVDTNGTVIWSKCIGTIGNEYFNNIYEANNGDLLLAGLIGSELWAVRCDSIGNVLWQGSYGGSNMEEAYSITELGSGRIVLSGRISSIDGYGTGNHGSYDILLVCLDSMGGVQWSRCYGGSNGDTYSFSIFHLQDDEVLIGANTLSFDGDVSGNHGYIDAWFLHVDSVGNILNSYCLGGASEDLVFAMGLDQHGDNLMVGTTFSNNGMVSGNHGQSDYWVVSYTTLQSKIDELGGRSFTLYPNPGNDHVVINFSDKTPQDLYVKDLTGRVIKHFSIIVNPMNCRLEDMGPGIYFIGSPEVGYQRYVKVE
ncbi:MAG: T9SS type A sorting domain-containing protein [Bacteroidia bacterium]|nr:T9SS type A sorting domain-containing protein [Bacteroidia bacterium]MBP7771679.1 T9SS type A sorting domain-containing protein [Bacteroidia bacterium]